MSLDSIIHLFIYSFTFEILLYHAEFLKLNFRHERSEFQSLPAATTMEQSLSDSFERASFVMNVVIGHFLASLHYPHQLFAYQD